MAVCSSLSVVPNFHLNSNRKPSYRVKAQNLSGESVQFSDSISVNGSVSLIRDKGQTGSGAVGDGGNGRVKLEKKVVKADDFTELEVLWDDGYGSKTVKDYFEAAKEIINHDGGPPRWFSPVDCGRPIKDAPILLFLPGLDGTGLGLTLHHKALGKVFHLWCFHIPVYDRTPFEGLVELVEETLRLQYALRPDKPIYLLGDSFGGCLTLAVAARNPHIDLVVILANPATSFGRSQLQPLLPILEVLPEELHITIPYALSFVMGDPLKMASVDIEKKLPPRLRMDRLRDKLASLLPLLPGLCEIVPRETLLWKLKLLKSAADYANSRLHAVRAEVLVLASGKDNILPSQDEARRLRSLLKNCIVRCFKDNGHTLLLEDSISLLSVIKGTCKYRRSRRYDYVSDFLPPSRREYQYAMDEVIGLIRCATSSVIFSTLADGRIVKGLAGVPDEGPVLLVGYHMLMGFEIGPLSEAFVREKNILVRGMAHPAIFSAQMENSSNEFAYTDWLKVFGAYPVTPTNFFKLLSSKSHVLLYPGGAREALHYRGEQYKLFWPDHQEFVRMAARFGATIVPFGAVGEDDIAELVLDFNDLMKIPVLNDFTREVSRQAIRFRDQSSGEVANQELYLPGLLPKIPGRFYYLFSKPIPTKGRKDLLKDKEKAKEVYLHVKSEVENNISYLLKKREEDPYRSIVDRLAYSLLNAPTKGVPTFEP